MNGGCVRPTTRGTVLNDVSRENYDGPSRAEARARAEFSEAQVQNVMSSRVYVFGDADVEEDEINTDYLEMSEMRSRGKSRGNSGFIANHIEDNQPTYIERTICEGDTLQSVALKYGCPVSEIKRLNNFIQDQEFFGRTSVKVPTRRHGLLTELIHEEEKQLQRHKQERAAEGYEANEEEVDDGDEESQELLVRTLSIRDSLSSQGREAASFLARMDNDIKGIISSTRLKMDSLDEVTASLTCRRIHPLTRRESWFSGVDCGMRWWSLLVFMAVLCLLLPTAYYLYYTYQHPHR